MPSIEKNPCYQCEERHAHCHADCEKNSIWQEAHKLVLQAKRDERDFSAYIAGQIHIKERETLVKKKRRGM